MKQSSNYTIIEMQLLVDRKMPVRLLNRADQIVDCCSKDLLQFCTLTNTEMKKERTGLLISSHSYSIQEFHNKR